MIGDLAFLFVRLGNVPSRSYTAIGITDVIQNLNGTEENKIFCTGHYNMQRYITKTVVLC